MSVNSQPDSAYDSKGAFVGYGVLREGRTIATGGLITTRLRSPLTKLLIPFPTKVTFIVV